MTEVLPEPALQGHAAQTAAVPAHSQPMPSPSGAAHAALQVSHPNGSSVAHRGREKLHWGKEVWECLDAAVRREVKRTRVAARFMPVHRVPEHTTTIPADLVIEPLPAATFVPRWNAPSSPPVTSTPDTVDEGAVVRLVEFWVEFSLTPQQVEEEGHVDHSHHHHGHEHDHHE